MESKEELEKALVEVRKAYRLLHDYQRRIQDLVSYLGKKMGYNTDPEFSPNFSNKAKYGRSYKSKYWAWDYLNLYFARFDFGLQEREEGMLQMAVFIQNDTGFFDSKNENREMTDEFAPVNESESRIIFQFGINEDWSYEGVELAEVFKKDNREGSEKNIWFSDPKRKFIILAYPMERFFNNDSVDEVLKDVNEKVFRQLKLNPGKSLN